MFEYWLLNLPDGSHTGTTTDFLEIVCQISEKLDTQTAGRFVEALMDNKKDERIFLRVTEWKFEFSPNLVARPDEPEMTIVLHKVR